MTQTTASKSSEGNVDLSLYDLSLQITSCWTIKTQSNYQINDLVVFNEFKGSDYQLLRRLKLLDYFTDVIPRRIKLLDYFTDVIESTEVYEI